jgi:type II secretory ATPase GspE/PulE/Tfp pilus assembly ATPase PilB-like protein
MATKTMTAQEEISKCLDLEHGENFLLNGGAGSGKTFSLIETLKTIFAGNPDD